MDVNDLKVTHMREWNKFHTYVDDMEAYLQYRPVGPTMLDFYEVYVPIEDRGQKIGTLLVQEAMEYAEDDNFRVIDTCPFVSDFIDAHHEYEKLRVNAKESRDEYYKNLPEDIDL